MDEQQNTKVEETTEETKKKKTVPKVSVAEVEKKLKAQIRELKKENKKLTEELKRASTTANNNYEYATKAYADAEKAELRQSYHQKRNSDLIEVMTKMVQNVQNTIELSVQAINGIISHDYDKDIKEEGDE